MSPAPQHHVPGDLMVGYGAGSLPEAQALLVATHLALCPQCRAELALLEEVGGDVLHRLEPAPLAADSLAAMLGRIAAEPDPEPAPPPVAYDRPPVIPNPLRDYLGGDLASLTWSELTPGLRQVLLGLAVGGIQARLVEIGEGVVIPEHTHAGQELTLVLTGGLEDPYGHFERGDVSACDAAHTHSQRVVPGQPCVALVVSAAALVPLSEEARALAAIAGI